MKVVTKSFLRYLPRRLSLSLLQLLGVACGVAAVVGMTLSARSALKSFTQAVEFLRGNATHSIQRPVGPMEESLVIELARDPAVEWLSPVVDRRLSLPRGDTVHLLGIDPLLDRTVRPQIAETHWSRQNGGGGAKLPPFFSDERAVLVDAQFLETLRIPNGGTIETTKGPLRVEGTFPNPSGDPLILMDIGHAQKYFGLLGYVDRVDLILSDEPGFVSRWSKGFLVQSARQKRETFSGMLRAFRLNLEALSLLALFVGVFLIYNTAMFAVVSRRRDTGILRSLGANRNEIVGAFLAEILLLGITGGVLGGLMGYFLTRLLTGLIGQSISNLYFFLYPKPVTWSPWILVAGMGLGSFASLLGCAAPLRELMRIDPVRALSGRTASRQGVARAKRVAWGGLALLFLSLILLILPGSHVYLGFAGVFLFVLGASFLTGMVLVALHPGARKILETLGGLPGKMAAGNIRQNLGRTAVASAAFMVSLSMSIALGTMIGSFRHSLIWWMETQIRGDLYIGQISEAEVPEDFYEELLQMEGLGGVHPYRNVQTLYRNTSINVSAVGASVLQRYTRFGWLEGGNENWEPVKRGEVIISESFSRRFAVRPGDTVTLEGTRGPTPFKVAAVFYDYTTEHGLVMMDRSTFIKTFGDRTINDVSVFIDPDNPRRQELLQEVRRRAEARGLPVHTREQFYQTILDVFDATFAITRSMRAIAILVAFFGIAGSLLILFIERSKEFGIYRALGFSTGQVARMTLMEGLGMGLVSFFMSLAVGTGLAFLLIKVINIRSFNWTIFFHLEWQPYLLTAATAILASAGAAAYPIWKIFRIYPQIQIREE